MTKGGTSAQTTALSSTLVNVVVGSGDSIKFLSGSVSAKANWLAVSQILVLTTLTKFASHKAGVNTGFSGKGSIGVYDSGDNLVIGIRTDQDSHWTVINVLGGDSLIKTTATGIVAMNATNFGFTVTSINNLMNISFT